MSFLPWGLEPVNSHCPDWMPWVSLDPPPVKMSSALELTLSVTKLDASAPLTGGGVTLWSAKTWSQSCVAAVTALPSSSKGPVMLRSARSSSRATCTGRASRRRASDGRDLGPLLVRRGARSEPRSDRLTNRDITVLFLDWGANRTWIPGRGAGPGPLAAPRTDEQSGL